MGRITKHTAIVLCFLATLRLGGPAPSIATAGAVSAERRNQLYSYRWVYVSRSLSRDSDVQDIRRITATAAEHGLNGMVLAAGLDSLSLRSGDYIRRLAEVKEICAKNRIEIAE
jgi:hypothetical protein